MNLNIKHLVTLHHSSSTQLDRRAALQMVSCPSLRGPTHCIVDQYKFYIQHCVMTAASSLQ